MPARDGLPDRLRLGAISLAGLVLVLFFVYRGFPYDQLAENLAARVGHAMNVRITVQDVAPRLALLGPGIEATDVRIVRNDGNMLRIDRARLRPAWSLAWFRGDPAVHAEIETPLGAADGLLVLGDRRSWSGDLAGVDLTLLAAEIAWPGVNLTGTVDAKLDVEMGDGGPVGTCSFEAREGSLSLAAMPIPVPFATLQGELEFGGDQLVELHDVRLEGPLVTADLSGTIGQAQYFTDAPLNLEVDLSADPPVRDALSQFGVRVGRRSGEAKIRITGTPSVPKVR